MSNSQKQLTRLFLALLTIITFGTVGYRLLLDWDWVDALYMTVITITTVGYGEVRHLDSAGRIFTIVLVLVSFGVVAYGATTVTSMMMEAKLGSLLWRRRMDQKIKDLKNHYLVCGFGRTGRAVSSALASHGLRFVVVENSQERAEEVRERDWMVVVGDASVDEILHSAGIERARGLVAALGNDAENVYLVLSARQLRSSLTIVSWASSEEAEIKIRRAGADHVLSPYVLGGRRIATLLTTPHAVEFFDHAMGAGEASEIRIGEIEIGPGTPLAGNSLKGLAVGRDIGVIVIGIRRAAGNMVFNPAADTLLEENDVLIGLGAEKALEGFRRLLTKKGI